jgi:hypothetical protein
MYEIVSNVEIAEALLASYLASLAQAAPTITLHHDTRLDNEAAIGSADQVYPEIWRRLDAARVAAAATGRDLGFYDHVREHIGSDATFGVTSITTISTTTIAGAVPVLHGSRKIAHGNTNGARAARDAIACFRSVFSDLAWRAGSEPVPELRTGQRTATLLGVVGMLVLAGAIIAMLVMRS